MPMVLFKGARQAKVVRKTVTEATTKEGRKAWVKVYQNGTGAGSMILILNATASQEFGLAIGDKVELFFDKRRREIGIQKVRKNAKDASALRQHGSNASVLKVGFAAYYRENLEGLGVKHGDRFELAKNDEGMLIAKVSRARGSRKEAEPAIA